MVSPKSINILGATGSIGQSATKVILANIQYFDVHAVTANERVELLAKTAIDLQAKTAVIVNEDKLEDLRRALDGADIECLGGAAALLQVASREVDVTLAAIIGMAGLETIVAAIQNSYAVAIANKEPLVAAGDFITALADENECTLLPVDSEHNAIFQVFDYKRRETIERIILTASGGPFLSWSKEDMDAASVEQALAHPNWSMGDKISIDSATMMNKALEVIEAHYLFDMPADKIDVVIHPQSIVHSMVEYKDGSILSQMGASDMCTPIANVLAWPERLETSGGRLDLKTLSALTFESPDLEKFPAIKLAYDCLEQGQYACVAFNASNEIAVAAFLLGDISFGDIMRCVEYIVGQAQKKELPTIKDILSYDRDIRAGAQAFINNLNNPKKEAAL